MVAAGTPTSLDCASAAGPSERPGRFKENLENSETQNELRDEHGSLNSIFSHNSRKRDPPSTYKLFEATWSAGEICLHDWGKKNNDIS